VGVSDYIDIPAATIPQVKRALNGHMVLIDDDVQNVARDLQQISDDLFLHYDAAQDIWVVMQDKDGWETFVTSARELDQRLVQRVRQVCSPGYDLAGEVERAQADADAEHDRVQRDRFGEASDQLAHALRVDFGVKKNF
jgi:hypothetical protein